MSVSEVEPAFSESSAQDTALASREAQEWIEAVTGRTFSASFRECLEDGVLLCELMQRINPGSIQKISKSRSPIAHLDNIQQFLAACRELGMKDAQLFDCMALQKPQGAKASTWRTEADRRIRNVCSTLYWLGRTVAEIGSYSGPQLDLAAFRNIMEHTHLSCSDEDSSLEQHSQADGENGFGLTFEQEQTADQLMADIQHAVDEMLQDFTSLLPHHPPPTAPHGSGRLGVSVHMSGRGGSFGFQVVGGADTNYPSRVEVVLPGSAAEEAGLLPGDEIVSVNKQDITGYTHSQLVRTIKKAGAEGSILMGLVRELRPVDHSASSEKPQENGTDDLTSSQLTNGHAATPPSKPRPTTPPPKPSKRLSNKQLEVEWQEEQRERERQAREIALLRHPPSLGPQGIKSSTPTESSSSAQAEQLSRLLDFHPPPVAAKQPNALLSLSTLSEPLPPPVAAKQPNALLESLSTLSEPLPPPVAAKQPNALLESLSTLSEPLPPPVAAKQPNALLESLSTLSEPLPPPVAAKQPNALLESLSTLSEPLPPPEAAEQLLEPLPPPEAAKPKLEPLPPPEAGEQLLEPVLPFAVEVEDLLGPIILPDTEIVEPEPLSAEESFPPDIPMEHPQSTSEGGSLSQSSRSASPSDSSGEEYDPQPYAPTSEAAVPIETTREPPMVLPEEPPAAELTLEPITEECFGEELTSSPESSIDESSVLRPSKESAPRPVSEQPVTTQVFKQKPIRTNVAEQPLLARYSEPTLEQPPEKPLEEPNPEESSLATILQPAVVQIPETVELPSELKIYKIEQTRWTPQLKHWTLTQWEAPETLSPTHSPSKQWSPELTPQALPGRQQQQASRHQVSPPTLHNGQIPGQLQAPPPTRKHSEPHPPSMPKYPPAVRSYTWGSKDRHKDGPQQAYAIRASNTYEPCSRCHKPLGGGHVMSLPRAHLQFHLYCFTCYVCHMALTRRAQNTIVLVHGNMPHCRHCISNEKGVMTTEC